MARFEVQGLETLSEQLMRMDRRENARRIVAAGADACAKALSERMKKQGHIQTGSMLESVQPGRYHEDLDVCWQEVYPQGDDARGVSNAKKAFVINYGYGGRRTAKTGDKFITGKKEALKQTVGEAMKAEAEKILKETRE